MFSKEITTSDVFVDMPASSQLLYFHLGMEADDDGFLGNARMLSRAYGTNPDDLKLLEAKGFIISFPTGVTVIKDWKVNNQIRKDRYKPTIYTEEKERLIVDTTGSYQLGNQMATKPQPNDNQAGDKMETQDRLGKDRLGKDRLVEVRDIYDYYEQNGFGSISSKTITDFQYWIEDFMKIGATQEDAIEIIIYALGIAIDNNVRKYNYVNSILKDWEKKLFKKVTQIQAEDVKYNKSEKVTTNSSVNF